MPEDVKRRVQTERREHTSRLADELEKDGTLNLDELQVLIREELNIIDWARGAAAKSKSAQYTSNMVKAEENAKLVVSKLRRAGKLFGNGKPKSAASLLREVAVTGSKVSKTKAASFSALYLDYLAARDPDFQQWLKDGQPELTPALPKARRVRAARPDSNRPEDNER